MNEVFQIWRLLESYENSKNLLRYSQDTKECYYIISEIDNLRKLVLRSA